MKFNWGTGIFIIILIFLLAVVVFFIFITNLDINLVEDNYYEKELVYQERIDKIKNTSSLPEEIKFIQEPGTIIIQFPGMDSTLSPVGTLLFYRPSDPVMDFSIPLQLDDSLRQVLDINRLAEGKWIIKIEWEMDEKEYYFEESLNIAH